MACAHLSWRSKSAGFSKSRSAFTAAGPLMILSEYDCTTTSSFPSQACGSRQSGSNAQARTAREQELRGRSPPKKPPQDSTRCYCTSPWKRGESSFPPFFCNRVNNLVNPTGLFGRFNEGAKFLSLFLRDIQHVHPLRGFPRAIFQH